MEINICAEVYVPGRNKYKCPRQTNVVITKLLKVITSMQVLFVLKY